MTRLLIWICLALCLGGGKASAQSSSPYADLGFRAPVDIPMALSGNFGEFRKNHFHTGLDIKTQGREGIDLFSCHDGYVSRIGVSPYGYGNVLYIDHPNGYTTVYAHMQSFAPLIQEWVRQQQYAQETYAIQLHPDPEQFPVKRGAFIGLSGNSGGSFGPHLHFEIRQTATEFPMNGLLFGFDITDTRAPEVPAIWVFDVADDAGKRYPVKRTSTGYRVAEPIARGGAKFGFGVETVDRLNGASNRCGVYTVTVFLRGDTLYHHRMDKLDFSTKRYINAHMDARQYGQNRRDVHRCYRQPNNALDIYHYPGNGQFITGEKEPFKVVVTDTYGNQTVVEGEIYDPIPGQESADVRSTFWNKDNFWQLDGVNVLLRKGSLYTSAHWSPASAASRSDALSPSIQIGADGESIQEEMLVELRVGELPADKQSKVLIARYDPAKKRYRCYGGAYMFGWVSTWVPELGRYQVLIDETPPSAEITSAGTGGVFRARISDNLSGIEFYEGRIDGEWVLFTYDYKKNRLEYRPKPGDIPSGEHTLTVTVRDERGNETVVEQEFSW